MKRLFAALLLFSAAGFAQDSQWKPLFDGKTLAGWKETDFVHKGKVSVKDETIILGMGAMTGITWTRDFPKSNYEIRLEAVRLEGSDFFCGLTVPVKDSHITWINGGWGGNLVGLSSLDDADASENETTTSLNFVNGRWYSFLLQVTDGYIKAWIDGKQMIDVSLQDRKVGLRLGEIELSAPLGFATWSSAAGLRKIEYRLLPSR